MAAVRASRSIQAAMAFGLLDSPVFIGLIRRGRSPRRTSVWQAFVNAALRTGQTVKGQAALRKPLDLRPNWRSQVDRARLQ